MDSEFVYVSAGGDRYRAHLLAELCRSEGIRVELLTADDSGMGPHLGHAQGHRLLVTAADEDRVKEIVAGG